MNYIFVFIIVSAIIFGPKSASSENGPANHLNDLNTGSAAEGPKLGHTETFSMTDTHSNSDNTSTSNRSADVVFDLASFLNDTYSRCNFECTTNFSTGWKDDTSFQISTTNNTNNTWSGIIGKETEVKPGTDYHLVSHMKLNKWATASHVALDGFNETSHRWRQIVQCPTATNGPLEWKEFNCFIEIPQNISKIRPVLNAGWSSVSNREAITWFDSPSMGKSIQPIILDPNLKIELVGQGLDRPSSMAFLGLGDILVLEFKEGKVQRIVNGSKLGEPVLDLKKNMTYPEGLLGIAVDKYTNLTDFDRDNKVTYVFIYAAGAKNENESVGNRLFRYEFINNTLVNPKVLLDLPPGIQHDGGPVIIGPDKYLYLAVGESQNLTSLSHEKNRALNYEGKDANDPDGRGGILRIDQNGDPIGNGILGDTEPLNKYYAYGIRNSFGIDFDPITGKLWDTENGPAFGDEINLVDPGFNSGSRKIQGIWTEGREEKKGNLTSDRPDDLVDFGGKGKYSSPEFTWNKTVGPTAIKFITTDKLGKQYENDIFVSDTNRQRIYHFGLNQNRTALDLQGPLSDRIADNDSELTDVVFAKDFGSRITDLKIGPDGYLYIVLVDVGRIYRIVPDDTSS